MLTNFSSIFFSCYYNSEKRINQRKKLFRFRKKISRLINLKQSKKNDHSYENDKVSLIIKLLQNVDNQQQQQLKHQINDRQVPIVHVLVQINRNQRRNNHRQQQQQRIPIFSERSISMMKTIFSRNIKPIKSNLMMILHRR